MIEIIIALVVFIAANILGKICGQRMAKRHASLAERCFENRMQAIYHRYTIK
jgi:hypothetical protein